MFCKMLPLDPSRRRVVAASGMGIEEVLFYDRLAPHLCVRAGVCSVCTPGRTLGISATGNEIAVQNCGVYEHAGNQVVGVWTFGDWFELLRQLGAVPGPVIGDST